VNELGAAVGFGYDPQGNRQAVLLLPIPEPATGTLSAMIILLVWRCGRRSTLD
jgi:hypothetical protein